MENWTMNSPLLQLEGLNLPQDSAHAAFLLFLTFYVVTVTLNLGFLLLIVTEKSLRQPMYVLLCNLMVSDVLGATDIFPQVLADLLRPPARRLLSYPACAAQAFVVQWYSSTCHTVLMVMAFDRYVAVCCPLRYAAVMTGRMVLRLSVSAWAVPFVLVAVLIGLSVRLDRCRTLVQSPFCDNASLFKLSCDQSVLINNAYGLSYTALLLAASVGCMALTYGKIAAACLSGRSRSLNRKALQTCSTHLVVYLVMSLSGFGAIALHRFPQYADVRKILVLLFCVVPGSLNTVIYAVQSKEVRKVLLQMFTGNRRPQIKNM